MTKIQSYLYLGVIVIALLLVGEFWEGKSVKVPYADEEPVPTIKPVASVDTSITSLSVPEEKLLPHTDSDIKNKEDIAIADFSIPSDWGSLHFVYSDGDTEVYTTDNSRIASVIHHIPSGRITFVVNGPQVKYFPEEHNDTIAQQLLYLLTADGSKEEIYKIPVEEVRNYGSMYEFYYSPKGNYLAVGWGFTDKMGTMIYDIPHKKEILLSAGRKLGITPGVVDLSRDILWSSDEKILAVKGHKTAVWSIGDFGGLLVSEYGFPERLHVVYDWELIEPPLLTLSPTTMNELRISELEIINNNVVQFSVEVCSDCYHDEEKKVLHSGKYQFQVLSQQLSKVF